MLAERTAIRMSRGEWMVTMLYADGMEARNVGLVLTTSIHTVLARIKRVRRRYAAAGRPAATKLQLRQRLVEDGHLS